ncbi:hypothetical protein EZ428_13100 [Pedobacter frigiditerrae]|uniref:Uncharacterized protein n=1 Tax=Pedobacter frigiditerrae TaxID=2530452 RepID=A0A4R0MVI5_9SPHI|nr:hypothetical protein [Pedobacter frigiditerrae]TCC90212.1 hypothetical protein EZ428_13100 [Pedobacter frigiditerrae]
MGTIKGKFIKGKAGSLVFREYRGTQVVSGLPKVIKSHRTEGTKKAATLFGKSSKLAGGIRRGLGYICGKFYDGTMIYRSNTEILRCLTAARDPEKQFDFNADSFRTLAGFEFNVGSMVKNHFYVQPQVTIEGNTLKVTVPEIKIPTDLKWPIDRLKTCKLLIATIGIDLKRGSTKFAEPQVMDIPYTYKPSLVASQTFEFEMIPGCLYVTAISLQYVEETFIGETTINTKDFNPAAILHAHIADGITDPALTKGWHQFDEKGY